MVTSRVMSSVVLIGVLLAASPLFAQERQRRRNGEDRAEQQAARSDRAVARARAGDNGRREQAQQAPAQAPAQPQVQRQFRAEQQVRGQQQYRGDRQNRVERQYDTRRDYAVRRDAQRPYYGDRNYYGSYPNRNYGNYSNRGYGYYSNRGYGAHTVIVPRYISPRFVTVVPYRPYVYRPSIGLGVFYGAGGSYPYGYTPRGYYDPIVGRAYGGLRITGVSRLAQVFADGYYVGIVNDFDGVFQHLNLEAGPHQIEIRDPGFQPIAFDVMIQPGRTITFRGDEYRD